MKSKAVLSGAAARNILRRAIGALRRRELARFHWFGDKNGCDLFWSNPGSIKLTDVAEVCAMGALAIGSCRPWEPSSVKPYAEAKRFLSLAIPDNKGIATWNDEPDRTKEEVLQAFRDAIKWSYREERRSEESAT